MYSIYQMSMIVSTKKELTDKELAEKIQKRLMRRKEASLKYRQSEKGKKKRREAQKRYYYRLMAERQRLKLAGLIQ